MEEKMMEILENEELMSGLLLAEDSQQLQKALDEQDMELEGVTCEEMFEMIQSKKARSEDEALTDDELDLISGGAYDIAAILWGSTQFLVWAKVVVPVTLVLVGIAVVKHVRDKNRKK